MDLFQKKVEHVLNFPAMAPVKVKYEAFMHVPQKQKAKLFGIASVLSFFFFLIILIVLQGTTEKDITKSKTAVVVFLEALPDDLLALRYMMMRPDYYTAAIVVTGSGVASSLKPSSENLEKYLTLMASEGNAAAANVPVYYGTSFSTSPSQRISTAASTTASLPATPLSAAASALNNVTKVIGYPDEPKKCSMTSRFVEDDVLYRGDTLFGARMYLPKRKVGVRGYVDRTATDKYAANEASIASQKLRFGTDPRSSTPFYLPLANDVLLPLQQQGVAIRALVLGPTTDLVTLLRRSYNPDKKATIMPTFPNPRVFDDIVMAGGAFGATTVGDVGTYISTLLGSTGPINVHAQENFFFDAPSAHTILEGGTAYNDKFAAEMGPIITLVSSNAASSASFSQGTWNSIVDARSSAITVENADSNSVALKGLANIRRTASTLPPLFTFDMSAPLDLVAAVVMTDYKSIVQNAVVDRVHVDDNNIVANEGVTGKGTRTTSPLRTVVLGVKGSDMWSVAQTYLFNRPNPASV